MIEKLCLWSWSCHSLSFSQFCPVVDVGLFHSLGSGLLLIIMQYRKHLQVVFFAPFVTLALARKSRCASFYAQVHEKLSTYTEPLVLAQCQLPKVWSCLGLCFVLVSGKSYCALGHITTNSTTALNNKCNPCTLKPDFNYSSAPVIFKTGDREPH